MFSLRKKKENQVKEKRKKRLPYRAQNLVNAMKTTSYISESQNVAIRTINGAFRTLNSTDTTLKCRLQDTYQNRKLTQKRQNVADMEVDSVLLGCRVGVTTICASSIKV